MGRRLRGRRSTVRDVDCPVERSVRRGSKLLGGGDLAVSPRSVRPFQLGGHLDLGRLENWAKAFENTARLMDSREHRDREWFWESLRGLCAALEADHALGQFLREEMFPGHWIGFYDNLVKLRTLSSNSTLDRTFNYMGNPIPNWGRDAVINTGITLRNFHVFLAGRKNPDAPPQPGDPEVASAIRAKVGDKAAASYITAMRDVADESRDSFSGTANELREALKHVLDHLAPDAVLLAQPAFVGKRDDGKPTWKQKAEHVLKGNKAATATPSLARIESGIEGLASPANARASGSVHSVGAERQEVLTIAGYVSSLLRDLLL
jgi:hypothetical protein